MAKNKQIDIRERALRKPAGIVRRLNEGETVTVRFLYEFGPDSPGWGWLASAFDEDRGRTAFFEDDEDIPPGTKNVRESFFAAAFDCEDKNRDLPLDVWELRKSLVEKLVEYDAEYGSITDRNYKIRRRGTGLETTYAATPMDARPMGKKMLRAQKEADGMLADRVDQLLSDQ